MKNIILAGPPRSGKTTLARRINKELGCFVISVDKLVAVFAGAYPHLDIRLNWNRKKTTENLAPFLAHFLGAFSSGQGIMQELNMRAHAIEGNRFVLEGAYFDLDAMLPVLNAYGIKDLKERFALIGLVQNEKTADDFMNDLKEYDTEDDWTHNFTDEERWDYVVQDALPYSRSMTDHLRKHGFTIYDTSADREKVFEKIMEDLKREMNI